MNLYTFALNDPLMRIDLYGLQSYHKIIGKYKVPTRQIYYLNGMYTTANEAEHMAQKISNHYGGAQVHLVYVSSALSEMKSSFSTKRNLFAVGLKDMIEAAAVQSIGITTEAGKILRENLIQSAKELPDDGKILLWAFSKGNIVAENELWEIGDFVRKKVEINSLGGIFVLSPKIASRVTNYIVEDDVFAMAKIRYYESFDLNSWGLHYPLTEQYKKQYNIKILPPGGGHSIENGSYEELISDYGKSFQQSFQQYLGENR